MKASIIGLCLIFVMGCTTQSVSEKGQSVLNQLDHEEDWTIPEFGSSRLWVLQSEKTNLKLTVGYRGTTYVFLGRDDVTSLLNDTDRFEISEKIKAVHARLKQKRQQELEQKAFPAK